MFVCFFFFQTRFSFQQHMQVQCQQRKAKLWNSVLAKVQAQLELSSNLASSQLKLRDFSVEGPPTEISTS